MLLLFSKHCVGSSSPCSYLSWASNLSFFCFASLSFCTFSSSSLVCWTAFSSAAFFFCAFTTQKNSHSAEFVHSQPQFCPKWADRAQNYLNVVTPWHVHVHRIWSGSAAFTSRSFFCSSRNALYFVCAERVLCIISLVSSMLLADFPVCLIPSFMIRIAVIVSSRRHYFFPLLLCFY